jgi:peptide-methionine (S)-S-oxide reductase
MGGGCFWCLEAIYQQVKGVLQIVSGYCGGSTPNPTYHQVCTGSTEHAEVIQITYDAKIVSYGNLLEIFFHLHDPTTLNRQGPDIGDQYRSAIFYHTPEQEVLAKKSKETLTASGKWKNPIVTQIVPAQTFWCAEDYHQQYLAKRGLGSCYTS